MIFKFLYFSKKRVISYLLPAVLGLSLNTLSFASEGVGLTTAEESSFCDSGQVTITFRGSMDKHDWVGIFSKEQALSEGDSSIEEQITAYKYTKDAKGIALCFDNIPAGDYFAQMFEDHGYNFIGTAKHFSVSANEPSHPPQDEDLSYNLAAECVSGMLQVKYAYSNSANDLVGVYEEGNFANSCNISKTDKFSKYQYASKETGELIFNTRLLQNKKYLIGMFNDHYCHMSEPKALPDCTPITAPILFAGVNRNNQVVVAYTGSKNSGDWIGIYPAGFITTNCKKFQYKDSSGDWKYARKSSDKITFESLPAGDYSVRMFAKDEYCMISNVVNITIGH